MQGIPPTQTSDATISQPHPIRGPEPLAPPRLSGGQFLLGHTLEFQRDPMALLGRGYRELGPVFEFAAGGQRFVCLAGPALHDAYFRAPEDQLSAKAVYGFTVPIFGRGIAYDAPSELMAEQVGFLRPALNTQRMRSYAERMRDEVALYTDAWGDRGDLNLSEATNELTINIASRCLLGDEIRENLAGGFAELYHDLQGGINAIGFIAPNLPTPAHRRRDRARKEVVALLGKILAERRRTGRVAEDFMQSLMESRYSDGRALTDHEIAGILMTALFGGQHTSGVLAAWVGVELLQHPHALSPVLRELDDVYRDGRELSMASLKEQVQLERAVKECERLHPPLPLLVRKVMRDFDVAGYRIPAGRLAVVSPGLSHRLPDVFSDPHRFDPERFAPPREEDARQSHSLVSFGGGKRRCIGQAFAYMQIKTIWTVIFSRFELELASPVPAQDQKSWVAGPKDPCRIRYRRRAAAKREQAA